MNKDLFNKINHYNSKFIFDLISSLFYNYKYKNNYKLIIKNSINLKLSKKYKGVGSNVEGKPLNIKNSSLTTTM